MTPIIKNRFAFWSKVCLALAILCFILAGVALVFATVVPPGSDAICVVGASGMSPGVELAIVQNGIYQPNSTILAKLGSPLSTNSTWEGYYDTKIFGLDWLWIIAHLM